MRKKNNLYLKAAFVIALTLALIIPGSTAIAITAVPSLDNHQLESSTPAVSKEPTAPKTVEPTASGAGSNDKGNITNYPPVISNEYPHNGATNVPITLSMLTVTIEDPDGDGFMWTIDTSPYIGSNSDFSIYNGTKICSISGLHYNTTYWWMVNATDNGSGQTSTAFYTFTTRRINLTRGDANRDGVINAADIVYLVNYLYKYGPAPNPLWLGDFMVDGIVNVGDIVALTNYLYRTPINTTPGNTTGPSLILGGAGGETSKVDPSVLNPPSPSRPEGINGSQTNYSRGDANSDGSINVADVVYLINYLYKKGPAPKPLWLGDFNGDERVDIADINALTNYLYRTPAGNTTRPPL